MVTRIAGLLEKRMRGGTLRSASAAPLRFSWRIAMLASRRSSAIGFDPFDNASRNNSRYALSLAGAEGNVAFESSICSKSTRRFSLSTFVRAEIVTIPNVDSLAPAR